MLHLPWKVLHTRLSQRMWWSTSACANFPVHVPFLFFPRRIFAALSPTTPEVIIEGMRAAKAKGGLVKQAMTLIALASSAFILLPAGRDIVSYETSILPGEAETRPLMTMAHSSSRTGMWGAPRSAQLPSSWRFPDAIDAAPSL